MEKNYCVNKKEIYLKYIFLSKISTLYLQYIQSKKYKRTFELIKTKKGIKIAKLYQFVSENFVNYYIFSKAHMKKNFRKINQGQNSKAEILKSNDNININGNNDA